MDPSSYQTMYSFEPIIFPQSENLFPPPTQFQWQGDEHAMYSSSYDYHAISPSVSSKCTASSQDLVDSQLVPIVSFPSSALANALTPTSPASSDTNDTVSISTIFHPEAFPIPDTILSASDGVIFYVNSQIILECCCTAFEEYLAAPLSDPKFRVSVIELDAPSLELNIILHTLYGTSAEAHSPDIETLVKAVDRMPTYGLPPQSLIQPSSPLYNLLLSRAPLCPLDVYALAAHHDLLPLAVSVSSHLLSYDLFAITDAMAKRISATYLKKLMLLHAGRFESLKRILLHPPYHHPPTKVCSLEDQKSLTRAWALVSAYLVWDSRPDLSVHRIQTTLTPLIEHVTCGMCHKILSEKVKDVLVRWASVKCTI
ncbi:hypothetical protein CPB84DRAFT_1703539 [Gymnopilus junonius]|uniref:BTB domain-containing protein n=1 Tax=Gymnopilus junonius TaxID=109634 RepID=A0A9P5TSC0_GYMJU|nr:hypothetical protein CPB84DRAFT_1703539 [Gymnopilus junonius]